jgi:hypothetical protein
MSINYHGDKLTLYTVTDSLHWLRLGYSQNNFSYTDYRMKLRSLAANRRGDAKESPLEQPEHLSGNKMQALGVQQVNLMLLSWH